MYFYKLLHKIRIAMCDNAVDTVENRKQWFIKKNTFELNTKHNYTLIYYNKLNILNNYLTKDHDFLSTPLRFCLTRVRTLNNLKDL